MLEERRTYSISEAAERLNVSVGWLRLAERTGAIPPARRRSPGGWRLYTPSDLQRLREIGVGSRPKRLKPHEGSPEAQR